MRFRDKIPPKRCIIKLGYRCNNSCLFCHSQEHKLSAWLSVEEAERRILSGQDAGFEQLLFSGGEPTIHPQFEDIAALAGRGCRTFGLITNGRMLSHAPFLKRLLGHGLAYVYLSLHGRQEIHDKLTRVPGSWAQTMRAIAGLSLCGGVETHVNMVVNSLNLREIPALVRYFATVQDTVKLKFSLIEPRGAARDDGSLHPHPVEAAAAVSAGLDLWARLGGQWDAIGVDGFPHCLDARFRELQDDMYSHGIVALQELADSTIYAVDYNNMRKPSPCSGCLLGDECRCTYSDTLERLGEEWLRPHQGFVPNSFNYLPDGESPPTKRPSRRAAAVRRIEVDLGNGPAAYVTDTGDFGDEQLAHIVDELGQVYVQRDEALFLSDFSGQLWKLLKEGGGGKSGRRAIWRPAPTELFTVADEPVIRLLAEVRGKVADVGCGPAYYFNRIMPAIETGEVSYTGVDPSPGPVIEQAASEGKIRLLRCGVEEAALEPRAFDWVLVLRSHNHLVDLWRAYRNIVRSLKWGGKLLVVDNIAFGLVRPGMTRELLDSIPAGSGLEHLRDHDGIAAQRFLARFPLRPIEVHHLGHETANQWVLLFEKAWPSGASGVEEF